MKASRAMAKLGKGVGQQAEILTELSTQVKRLEKKLDAALKLLREQAVTDKSE